MPLARKSDKPAETKSEVVPQAEYLEQVFDNTTVEIRAHISRELKDALTEAGGLFGGLSMSELLRMSIVTFLDRFSGAQSVLLSRKVESTGLTGTEVRNLIRDRYATITRKKSKNLKEGNT